MSTSFIRFLLCSKPQMHSHDRAHVRVLQTNPEGLGLERNGATTTQWMRVRVQLSQPLISFKYFCCFLWAREPLKATYNFLYIFYLGPCTIHLFSLGLVFFFRFRTHVEYHRNRTHDWVKSLSTKIKGISKMAIDLNNWIPFLNCLPCPWFSDCKLFLTTRMQTMFWN